MWPSLERSARYVRAAYVDARLLLTGKSESGIPPLRLRFVGTGDFRAIGEHLLWLAETRGQLKPDSRILDIGCGSGRLALPLTNFLVRGRYEGFDVVASAIRWCRRNITRQHPQFHFTHVSLRNSDYSARGGAAARFVFPYRDSSFDCVVAFSVFTHLQFDEMCNYLLESHRVLAPGGCFVATFFLLNEQSRAAQHSVPGVQQFPYSDGPLHFAKRSNPSHAVAVEEDVLRNLLSELGFRELKVETGCWFGVQDTVAFQDLVVCAK